MRNTDRLEEDGRRCACDVLVSEVSADALVVSVHIESIAANEAAQGNPGGRRELDGQTRWRRNRGNKRDTGQQGLLHELERRATRQDEDEVVKRERVFHHAPSDDLVDGVVPANVLCNVP